VPRRLVIRYVFSREQQEKTEKKKAPGMLMTTAACGTFLFFSQTEIAQQYAKIIASVAGKLPVKRFDGVEESE
jgi:hypothetical protein